eukprot:2502532-Pleurochrysis_carterae.AAC.2
MHCSGRIWYVPDRSASCRGVNPQRSTAFTSAPHSSTRNLAILSPSAREIPEGRLERTPTSAACWSAQHLNDSQQNVEAPVRTPNSVSVLSWARRCFECSIRMEGRRRQIVDMAKDCSNQVHLTSILQSTTLLSRVQRERLGAM